MAKKGFILLFTIKTTLKPLKTLFKYNFVKTVFVEIGPSSIKLAINSRSYYQFSKCHRIFCKSFLEYLYEILNSFSGYCYFVNVVLFCLLCSYFENYCWNKLSTGLWWFYNLFIYGVAIIVHCLYCCCCLCCSLLHTYFSSITN